MKATISKINDFLSLDVEKLGKSEELDNHEINIKHLSYSYNKYEKQLMILTYLYLKEVSIY